MKIYIVFLIFIFLGCSSRIKNASDECEQYYSFIKDNWILTDKGKMIYGFKGNPEYWKDVNKYFRDDCLIGLQKKQIINLFGQPPKYYVFKDYEVMYYCMTESCLNTMENSSREMIINFDSTHTVIGVFHNPDGEDSD